MSPFGELRSLFEHPPGPKPWRRLLRVLDRADRADAAALEAAVHYCTRALSTWPEAIERPLPAHWAFKPGSDMPQRPAHPAMVLGTSFEVRPPVAPAALWRGVPGAPSLDTLRIHKDAHLTAHKLVELWSSPTFSCLHTLKLPPMSLTTSRAFDLLRVPGPKRLLRVEGGMRFESLDAFKLFGRDDHLPHLAHLECTLVGAAPESLGRVFDHGHFGALESLSLHARRPRHLMHALSHHERPWKRLCLSSDVLMSSDLHLISEHRAFSQLQELGLREISLHERSALGFLCGAGHPTLDTLSMTQVHASTEGWLLGMEHAQVPRLRHLDISMIQGLDLQRADLPGRLAKSSILPGLETLWADYFPMPGPLIDAMLHATRGLRSLSLSSSLDHVQGFGVVLDYLKGASALCRLDLSFNGLSAAKLTALLDHSAHLELQELQLHHNARVSDAWVARVLREHPRLEVLSIDAANLTHAAHQALIAAAYHGSLTHLILHQKHRPRPFDDSQCDALLDAGIELEWEA